MMHPDHFDAIRIMLLAGLSAVIGSGVAKAGVRIWEACQ